MRCGTRDVWQYWMYVVDMTGVFKFLFPENVNTVLQPKYSSSYQLYHYVGLFE
jgi:hypothetical protein